MKMATSEELFPNEERRRAQRNCSWLVPPVYKVGLFREPGGFDPRRNEVWNQQSAANLLRTYLKDADREHVIVLLLDTRNRMIGMNTVHIGTLDQCEARLADIFKPAILANAAALVLAHNHPSGQVNPSREDETLTQMAEKAGKLLGIRVLDHLIVGEDGFFSFRSSGFFENTGTERQAPKAGKGRGR